MKKANKLLFTLILLLTFSYVKAECTNEEITKLKEEADKIEVTYKHLGAVETDEGTDYNFFQINIKNIPNDFYVTYFDDTEKLLPENNKISKKIYYGTWNLKIYSNNCEEVLDNIEVKLPKFNVYSLDPLCEGIDGEKFPLCGKYYEQDVSYDNFKKRVEHYRITYKTDDKNSENSKTKNRHLNNLITYFNNYKIYFLSSMIIILLAIITSLVVKKRRNRGVLK